MFKVGDRVRMDFPPYHHGTVEESNGSLVHVRWDGKSITSWHFEKTLTKMGKVMFKKGDRVQLASDHYTRHSPVFQPMVGTVKETYTHGSRRIIVYWDEDEYICPYHFREDELQLVTQKNPMSSENTFWVVWNPRRGSTVKHGDEDEAKREAERLSLKHPGEEFHVLELKGTVVTKNNPTTRWT